MIQLEKDHFMAHGVASKNCEAIYPICVSFFLPALSSSMCVLPKNMSKREKAPTLTSCIIQWTHSVAEMIGELPLKE